MCCKPTGGSFQPEEEMENNILTEFRGDIERRFATLVNKFNVVKHTYRHGERTFNYEFKLCKWFYFTIMTIGCALLNAELEGKSNNDENPVSAFFSCNFFEIIPPNEEAPNNDVPVLSQRLFGDKFAAGILKLYFA